MKRKRVLWSLLALLIAAGCTIPALFSTPTPVLESADIVSTAVVATLTAVAEAAPAPRGLVSKVATSDATVTFDATAGAPARTKTAYIASNRVHWVWISGFERCPSHSEYGLLVVNGARIWKDTRSGGATQEKILHGTRVRLIGRAGSGFTTVRYNGKDVLVQTMLVVDYDPSGGVRPDKTQCW